MSGGKRIRNLVGKVPRPPPQVVGCLRTNALTLATMAGVIIGVVVGVILNSYDDKYDGYTPRQVRAKERGLATH